MDPRWQRIKQLFLAAAALPPAERAAFLARECAGDADLQTEVEALLRARPPGDAAPTAGLPWSAPSAAGGAGTLSAGGAGILPADSSAAASTVSAAALQEKPGTRIGPYKLLQQIGEGGFGVVFMAEQDRPVRRRVALPLGKGYFRLGCPVDAFSALARGIASVRNSGNPSCPEDLAYLAMAQSQLNDRQSANAALTEAREAMTAVDWNNSFDCGYCSGYECQAILAEAAALIEGNSSPWPQSSNSPLHRNHDPEAGGTDGPPGR